MAGCRAVYAANNAYSLAAVLDSDNLLFLARKYENAAEIRKPNPEHVKSIPRVSRSQRPWRWPEAIRAAPEKSMTRPIFTAFMIELSGLVTASVKLRTYFCPAGDCMNSAKSCADENFSSSALCISFFCLRRAMEAPR